MLKSTLMGFILPLLLLFCSNSDNSVAGVKKQKSTEIPTETVEKLIAASGSVTMDVDLHRLNDAGAATEESKPLGPELVAEGLETLRFTLVPGSFFTIVVTNNVLRGPLPGSMGLIPQNTANLPALLSASFHQLILEKIESDEASDLVVRDSKSGFVFFNIEGSSYDYDANEHSFSIQGARMLVSKEFAAGLGRPSEAGSIAGKISIAATMRAIEITQVVAGETRSMIMPAVGTRPGPDVIVGEVAGVAQFGSSGTQVGLAVGTDACNPGVVDLNWFANPNNDHPAIPQNLYRMSGGATNNERFEQIGQSSVKHAFTAASSNTCGFGCNGVGGSRLGSGCSDLYSAGLNAGPNLGSRAWINPFTGVFPRNDSPTPNNNHTGHTHTGTSHRVLVEINDLTPTLNPGATYYAEGQYVTPHEYAWCQTHPGECNQYNNASYRRYNVTTAGSPFSFSSVGSTVRETPAIRAWTGATINQIEPAPGVDGIGLVGYKVTNPSPGVWHYEYALYDQNLDRAIQSFTVPLASGITVSNIGFHAPPQHPGSSADGTVGNAGYSSTPWTPVQTASSLTWSSETFAQNQNANAIRWGTLYNFRFDSDAPPQLTSAGVGYFKTGAPSTVVIQAPFVAGTPTPMLTPTPTPTPTATPTPTPTPGLLTVSGTISYCSNPVFDPVAGVTLTLTGTSSDSTLSDGSGNYQLSTLASGGNYTVTPSKAPRVPGSDNINTIDVIATQRHFLNLGTPLTGCRLTAGDVNGDTAIDTVDVIAIQRFYLGNTIGIANVGNYQFTPVDRTYTGIAGNQTGQNYDVLIFGDVTSDFVEGVNGASETATNEGTRTGEVGAVALPEVGVNQSMTNFVAAVKTSAIDAKNQLVGFQGDFTFDERVVTFQSQPVQKAGLTGGNWNVSGNVLPGTGPVRTLRISAYSNDFTALSGSGTLFELRMTRVSEAAPGAPLLWAAPPNQFIFIDANLKTQKPGNAAPGSVSPSGKRQ